MPNVINNFPNTPEVIRPRHILKLNKRTYVNKAIRNIMNDNKQGNTDNKTGRSNRLVWCMNWSGYNHKG